MQDNSAYLKIKGGYLTVKQKALDNFKGDLNCSQSVISAWCDEFGIDKDLIKAVSAGLGGGMGHSGKTCGAVSGAIMAIGCKYFDKNDVKGSKKVIYQKTNDFIKRFEQKYTDSTCKSLLGVDIGTEEGMAKCREKNMFATKCPEFIEDIFEILDDIFKEG